MWLRTWPESRGLIRGSFADEADDHSFGHAFGGLQLREAARRAAGRMLRYFRNG